MHHDEKNKIGLTVALSIVVGTIIGVRCVYETGQRIRLLGEF